MLVGPESVGHHLTRDARVFGGTVCTATDLVVAGGRAELGERARVGDVPGEVVKLGMQRMQKLLEGIIDKCVIDVDFFLLEMLLKGDLQDEDLA